MNDRPASRVRQFAGGDTSHPDSPFETRAIDMHFVSIHRVTNGHPDSHSLTCRTLRALGAVLRAVGTESRFG